MAPGTVVEERSKPWQWMAMKLRTSSCLILSLVLPPGEGEERALEVENEEDLEGVEPTRDRHPNLDGVLWSEHERGNAEARPSDRAPPPVENRYSHFHRVLSQEKVEGFPPHAWEGGRGRGVWLQGFSMYGLLVH